MSKIICDVCGTSYPDAATQCPICGCVRSADAKTVIVDTNNNDVNASGTYTYVKGGRFSKSNVRKRNSTKQTSAADTVSASMPEQDSDKKSNKGLVIAVIALLLAIIAAVIYIALRFFGPGTSNNNDYTGNAPSGNSIQNTTEDTMEDTTEPSSAEIPCTGLTVSDAVIEFDKVGAVLLLNVTPEPVDTTDEVVFSSDNEEVATVTADGKVEAVGGGQAIITITCGTASAQCRVVCDIEGVENTEATDPTTPSTGTNEEFKLLKNDVTLKKKGESWVCYKGSISVDDITWSSDNEKVATVSAGKVVAVGTGVTNIHAEYNGVKVSCVIRCAASVGTADDTQGVPGSGGVTEGGTSTGTYTISSTDVTIAVGEKFTLQLKDAQGNPVAVNWIVSNGSCTVNGNQVTGTAVGTAKVYVAYEGTEYACTVRVKG